MRSMLTATLMFVATGAAAQAQLTPPSTLGARPKQVATVPIRPGLQTPADTASAMAQAERVAIQSDLAWVGQYNGAITGDVSDRMVEAIKEHQKAGGGKATGVLNPKERSVLAETAKRRRDDVGLEDRDRSRHRGAARHPHQAGAAAILRRQRRQMELCPPGPSRSSFRGARRRTRLRRSSRSGKRKNPPGAISTTPWSSRISSCCPACRV